MPADAGDTDAQLASRACEGDRDALETLLDRHVGRVHAICRRIVVDPDDALDATQDALLAVARGVCRFDGRAAFTTWLYRVATNAALDEVRRRARRPRPEARLPDVVAVHDATTQVAERVDLDAALQTLAPDFRAALVLRDVLDLDYAQIAAVLEIPPGTVRSRIARGRAALARALGDASRVASPPTGSERS